MKIVRSLAVAALVLTPLGSARAQQLYVYPEKGQSQSQTDQDKYACYEWARGQTGFDPMQQPMATSPEPSGTTGSTGRSTAKGGLFGAAGGAAIGAIAGNAGMGAAIGAVAGGLIGGIRRHEKNEQAQSNQQQWANQQAAQYDQGRSQYNQAYSACLRGRGYSVS